MGFAVLCLLSLAAPPPGPAADLETELRRGIARFSTFDDRGAGEAFQDVIRRAPDAETAARAHLYLGIMAANANRIDDAKLEFSKAVAVDPTLELPRPASEKIELLLIQVRRRRLAELGSTAAPHLAPPAAAITGPPPALLRPSHLPAYLAGGGAVLAIAAGAVLGGLQSTLPSRAHEAGTVSAAETTAAPYAAYGTAANVLFAVGTVGAIVSVVLFLTERPGASARAIASSGTGLVGISF